KDAVDYCAPAPGDTLLDVGCGYGGQLVVSLEHHDFAKIVGWTHSSNQAREGEGLLSRFDPARWELNEGDYREDDRVFDHVMSTGMISHVGPRGLVPYVRNVRRRIRKGGRYVHHALMTAHSRLPHGFDVGHIFNKKYVWPGFHWFTVGTHVKALEENGFQVRRAVDLSMHYAKTTAAWYERFMAHAELASRTLGEPTFRAWRVFMAGVHGGFLNRTTHVYRLYCEAV
ncbi:MAG TPA: class I SAM-dependent methyltransferase, partial [Candidatus Thermoplasmatota archaeon]